MVFNKHYIPESFTLVELGSGDYHNAIALKQIFSMPVNIITTNSLSEWRMGRFFAEKGVDNHVTAMYQGWLQAQQQEIITGDTQPYQLEDLPSNIADVVLTIMPPPKLTQFFANHALRLLKPSGGLFVFTGQVMQNPKSAWKQLEHYFAQHQFVLHTSPPFLDLMPDYVWESQDGELVSKFCYIKTSF